MGFELTERVAVRDDAIVNATSRLNLLPDENICFVELQQQSGEPLTDRQVSRSTLGD